MKKAPSTPKLAVCAYARLVAVILLLSPLNLYGAEKIVFTKAPLGGSDSDLWLMNPDGSGPVILKDDPGSIETAQIAPDGMSIFYGSTASTTTKRELFRIGIDDLNAQQITSNNDQHGCHWPRFFDSLHIWYVRGPVDGVNEWWQMNYDGTGQVQISNWQAQGKQSASFSFDSARTKVVYELGNPSWAFSHEIWIANIDLTNAQQLTSNSQNDGRPDLSPDGSKIVWHNEAVPWTNSLDIWFMNGDGTNKVNLTNVPSGHSAMFPSFSPDGSRILYSYRDGTQWDVYAMDLDGSNKTNLTNTPDSDEFGWHTGNIVDARPFSVLLSKTHTVATMGLYALNPDNSSSSLLHHGGGNLESADINIHRNRIAFGSTASSTGKREIFTADLSGCNVRQITSNNDEYSCHWPRFFDSLHIWYVRGPVAGVNEWWQMNYDGTGQVQISNWQAQGKQSASFSFDSARTKVVYELGNPSWAFSHEIWIANIDLTNAQQLTSNSQNDGRPDLSPDGSKIVWHNEAVPWTNSLDIWFMNGDGTNKVNLTNVPSGHSAMFPSFSPDGSRILYSYRDGTQWDVYAMDLDGSNKTNLTNTADADELGWAAASEALGTIRQPVWKASIHLWDAGGKNGNLVFGQGIGATDGLDPDFGEADLPPVPPSGIFDRRFLPPTSAAVASLVDIRPAAANAVSWHMAYQHQNGYPVVMKWVGADLPQGSFVLTDNLSFWIDMKGRDSAVFTAGTGHLYIIYRQVLCRTQQADSGWNLMSAPVELPDMTADMVFPGRVGGPFRFDGSSGYVLEDTVKPGVGYWVKYPSPTTRDLCGMAWGIRQAPVRVGWNLIGPFEDPIDTSALTYEPADLRSSYYYEFSGGYEASRVLQPSRAYWVKARSAGTIHFPVPMTQNKMVGLPDRPSDHVAEAWISFTDASGTSRHVALMSGSSLDEPCNEVPPMPPSGVPDARFSSQMFAEPLEAEMHTVRLTSMIFPVKISLVNGGGLTFDVVVDGSTKGRVSASTSVLLFPPAGEIVFKQTGSHERPVEYHLSQNFPNPFNPATTITYALPSRERVSLRVYDVLGREVAVLVDGYQERGVQSVTFDGQGFASGVYVYRLQAGSYADTKKMVLTK